MSEGHPFAAILTEPQRAEIYNATHPDRLPAA